MYSLELEQDIIGSLMNYPELMNEVRDIINPKKFSQENELIYTAIYELEKSSQPHDLMMVINYLKSKGVQVDWMHLSQLNGNYNPTGIAEKASIINELWMKRELAKFGQEITKKALERFNDVYDLIAIMNQKADELLKDNSSGVFHISDCVQDVMQVIDDNINDRITGVLSGLKELDNFTHGDQKGDLIIVAGDTSQGKTAFALSKAFYQALNGYQVAFFSYEMSRNQITARLMALASSISSKKILMDKLNSLEINQINERISNLLNTNLFIIEVERKDLTWLENKIKTIVSKHGIESIIIDYIQLISVQGLKRNDEVAKVANSLKFLAKHKNVQVPITLLSQFKRTEGNQIPTLSRLKESGDIENAADTVLGIWRPEHYGIDTVNIYQDGESKTVFTKNVMIGHILKGRNIGLKDFIFDWNAELTKVSNIKNDNPF
jgi:replicative DNA helicase